MKAIYKVANEFTNTIDEAKLENVLSVDFSTENGCYVFTYDNGRRKRFVPSERLLEIDLIEVDQKTIALV